MQPQPSARPTRRALLWAGATFAAGAAIGAATGHSLATAQRHQRPVPQPTNLSTNTPTNKRANPTPPTADPSPELAELRRLATAPIAELMPRAVLFLDLLRTHHRDDADLWRGAERIASELLRTPDLRPHRKLALWLAQITAASDPQHTRRLRQLLEQLLQRQELAVRP